MHQIFTYSFTGEIKYDLNNEDNKYWLYAQFAAFNCGDCTTAP